MNTSTRRLFTLCCSLLLLTVPLAASAQKLPELLQPVDAQTLARLEGKSNYGFREQLYFAKRHRIVTINLEVLQQQGAQFTVTPFDDMQVRAVAKQLSGPSSSEQLTEWRGQLVTAEVRGTDAAGNPVTLPPMPLNLWIRTGDHEIPPKLARELALASAGSRTPAMAPEPPAAGAAQKLATKLPLRTVSGRWLVVERATNLVLQPIEDDPRFHVVYEEDPAKVVRAAHELGASEQAKLQRHKEFVEQLRQERTREEAAKR